MTVFIVLRCPKCKREHEVTDEDGKLQWWHFLTADLVCKCGATMHKAVAKTMGIKPKANESDAA